MPDRSFRVLRRVRNWTGGSGQTAEFRGPSQKEAARRPPVLNEWALLFKTASAPSANAEQPLLSLRVLNLGLRFKDQSGPRKSRLTNGAVVFDRSLPCQIPLSHRAAHNSLAS